MSYVVRMMIREEQDHVVGDRELPPINSYESGVQSPATSKLFSKTIM